MLDGKVAVVTGAARGLGRVEALELARLGARVVVNDLGGDADGTGKAEEPAREVVEEIKAMGGEAVPHFGDVADWNDSKSMIETAINEFGELNILVNNAGFLRDATIFSMSEQDFDSVVRVHLKGHFCGMRHATAYWRETAKSKGTAPYGRLISTASEAAIFGSAGQPNYSAAKAGIVAMTMGAAQLMLKYGITANAIMPRARTRMTSSGPTAAMFNKPEEGFDTFGPEHIGPVVGFLASPEAQRITGQVFVCWGKNLNILDAPKQETRFESDEAWTVESLAAQVGAHFEKLDPIFPGFTVDPMNP